MTSPTSLLDQPAFSQRLFFPRRDEGAPPEWARDLMVTVDGAQLHMRLHRAAASVACVLFAGGRSQRHPMHQRYWDEPVGGPGGLTLTPVGSGAAPAFRLFGK